MNLDNETGITIMKIVEELDAGPVMHQEKIKINEKVDAATLSNVLSKMGAKSIVRAIEKIEKGNFIFNEQNHKEATYAKKIQKIEGKINWNESAKKIIAKINGLNPDPGAWFMVNKVRHKIWKAEIVKNKEGKPGEVIDKQLIIACGEQAIKILEIQREGKNKQSINQFLLGSNIPQGEIVL